MSEADIASISQLIACCNRIKVKICTFIFLLAVRNKNNTFAVKKNVENDLIIDQYY